MYYAYSKYSSILFFYHSLHWPCSNFKSVCHGFSGQFGLIRKAVLYLNEGHTESAVVAVKMLRSVTASEINDILREAYTMYQFNHLNVLSIIGVVWQKRNPPLVVLPFMGKGSLLELVRNDSVVSDLISISWSVCVWVASSNSVYKYSHYSLTDAFFYQSGYLSCFYVP